MRKLKLLFHILFRTNLSKTVLLNFKMFPFRVAVRMPIWIYGRMTFRSLAGSIVLNGAIRTGMIKIGKNDYYVDTSIQQCIWTIRGKIVFNGPVNFGHGSYVLVSDNAVLTIGTHDTYFGSDLKIICFDKITVGDTVRVAWECQFIDTSFHYIELLNKNGEIKPLTKPIAIGDRVWVGNRSTLSKGSVIPSDTIVSSNSLVNKDFSGADPFGLIAGCPAALKGFGLKRVFDGKRQKELDEEFNYSRTHL